MRTSRARVFILALFLIAGSGVVKAQDTVRVVEGVPSTKSVQEDQSAASVQDDQGVQDGQGVQEGQSAQIVQKSPNIPKSPRTQKRQTAPKHSTTVAKEHSATKALLWSLLPGAGQVYNHQAWKIPIIYTAFAGVGYFIYTNGTNMVKFKKEYLYRVNNDGATQWAAYANYPTSNIYNLYQAYNKNFQLSVIIAAAFYGLNLIDAYVFGHLFDYDISDDISLRAAPTMLAVPDYPLPSAPGLSLTLTF